MAKNDPIPDEHDLIRYIKRRFLAKGDDGNVEIDEAGRPSIVFPDAFQLREGEDYLSLTSRNLHHADRQTGLKLAARAIQLSMASGNLSKTSAFAVGTCLDIKNACEEFSIKIRVLEEPEIDNIGHVAVRRFPIDNLELNELLCDDVFSERYFVQDLIKD